MQGYYGRTVIYSDVEEIDESNIIEVLQKVIPIHEQNANQIEFLYGYYKGKHEIYNRVKEVREDINYKIVENRCKEVVDFKAGYSIGAPIQYNDRTGENSDAINELNTIMDYEGRNSIDEMTVEWNLICGTAYKIALQKDEPDEISSIDIAALDPRQTFVIYSSGMWHKPLAGVWFVTDSENNTYHHVYTPTRYMKVENKEKVVERGINGIGYIPIVEFPANNARLGAFETILDIQDALDLIDSDRTNAIAQFVQSIIVATNCDFEDGVTLNDLANTGIVSLTSKDGMSQDIKILTAELNQAQTETLKEDLYDSILTICSMPSRKTNAGGDTGIAVVYRDGWSAAETAALKYETVYKRSEKKFLEVCLAIFDAVRGPKLRASDIEVKFTRKNYEGIAQKVEVLDKMLSNEKIAPRLAFIYSNLFPDPEEAYKESEAYIQSVKAIQPNDTTVREDVENASVREDV